MNLRKDHCRNLHSRLTRERVRHSGLGCWRDPWLPASFLSLGRVRLSESSPYGTITNPGAVCAKEYQYSVCLVLARFSVQGLGTRSIILKRLSATDISALASMKNVAKCDTWCELQNPVNHRVFERKLRPKPSGRGHVCLGVTHRVFPLPPLCGGRGRMMASHTPPGVVGLKKEPQVADCCGDRW